MAKRVLVERNVAVPMRDGVILRANVYRPDTSEPVPVVLSRLPYNKDLPGWQVMTDAVRLAEAGFAIVNQDTRGRFESDGEFYPFVNEGRDGYDTVEWAAAQPWSSGAVGMTGGSYFGATQWLAALERPPHLRALFPTITTSEYYESWTYQGGAFQLGFTLLWTLTSLAAENARRLGATTDDGMRGMVRLLAAADHLDEHYRYLPLAELPILKESKAAQFYFDWIAHANDDEYWQTIAINRRYGQVQVPAHNVGGWYDLFLHGTIENYVRMRREGGSPVAREGQRLLIGPWGHGAPTGAFPEHSFGIFASQDAADLNALQIRFFDHHLRGPNAELPAQPPVRIFVMGENRWRDEADWPLARARATPWYLRSQGNAGSTGGTLSLEPPSNEPVDVYLYDPRDPAPTVGGPTFLPGLFIGANAGPRDQRAAEARPDILTYTSAPLERPLEVTGPLSVTLYAATSASDTDFVARLIDVFPDGAARLLAEGIIRARFREGYSQPSPIEPNRVYAYAINLVATSNLFQAGHRIRVDVTSSSFPRFDRNPNTGHPLGVDGPDDLRPALQTIFRDGERASHVVLPVVERVA
jgi:putative CocE/NonD family hydrolase